MAEIEEQKQRWQQARNERRQKLYASDPNYRESVTKRNRESYISRSGSEAKDLTPRIARIPEFSEDRIVLCNGVQKSMATLSLRQLASLWEYDPISLQRWIADGRLPSPPIPNVTGGRHQPEAVYSDTQVRRMTEILAAHLTVKTYYQATDEETIAKMVAAVDTI